MATTPTGDRPPAVALEGIGRAYGERVALRAISFALPQGATVAVFGANGAGKTTLLRVLAGLLRPHAGSASVLGAELPREAYRVRGRIGLLGHEPMLYRDLTVRENLRFHARLHGVDCAACGGADRAGRPRRPRRRPGAHALARDDAARGDLPRGAARARAAAARRAAAPTSIPAARPPSSR